MELNHDRAWVIVSTSKIDMWGLYKKAFVMLIDYSRPWPAINIRRQRREIDFVLTGAESPRFVDICVATPAAQNRTINVD